MAPRASAWVACAQTLPVTHDAAEIEKNPRCRIFLSERYLQGITLFRSLSWISQEGHTFLITCHGFPQGGHTFLITCNGSPQGVTLFQSLIMDLPRGDTLPITYHGFPKGVTLFQSHFLDRG